MSSSSAILGSLFARSVDDALAFQGCHRRRLPCRGSPGPDFRRFSEQIYQPAPCDNQNRPDALMRGVTLVELVSALDHGPRKDVVRVPLAFLSAVCCAPDDDFDWARRSSGSSGRGAGARYGRRRTLRRLAPNPAVCIACAVEVVQHHPFGTASRLSSTPLSRMPTRSPCPGASILEMPARLTVAEHCSGASR